MSPEKPPKPARAAGAAAPIILASGSPRRKQMLELMGVRFEVEPSTIDERPIDGESPSHFAQRAAHDKALDISSHHPDRWVLGADTVVEVDGVILGKPTGAASAREMLRSLSGRDHLVHTGMALVVDGEVRGITDTARVHIIELDDDIISWYVNTGEPMDKAGGYAIQGIGGLLVEGIMGSPQTVIGLPMHRLPALFAEHGLDFWDLVGDARGR